MHVRIPPQGRVPKSVFRKTSPPQRQLRPEMPLLTFLVVVDRVFLLEGVSMLWTIFAILIILWLLGWGFHVAGGLIHLLLVIALVVAVINLVTGRRTV